MKILNKKYKELYSGIFVAVYVIFLIINFTHFHHLNISNNSVVILDNKVNNVDHLLFDSGECLIHQFSYSVIYSDYSNSVNEKVKKSDTNLFNTSNNHSNTLLLINSPLRAPPVDFSV